MTIVRRTTPYDCLARARNPYHAEIQSSAGRFRTIRTISRVGQGDGWVRAALSVAQRSLARDLSKIIRRPLFLKDVRMIIWRLACPKRTQFAGISARRSVDEPMMDDALILAQSARFLIEHKDAEAREVLGGLSREDPLPAPGVASATATSRPERRKRIAVPPSVSVPVYRRDGWRCRYCGRRLVIAGVIEIIGNRCPSEFPFPARHHMPVASTHPAAIRVYPNVDHVEAGSLGGPWLDQDNLVASCTPCNERKSDRIGWTPQPTLSDWDGLTGLYRALLDPAEQRRDFHRRWLDALAVPDAR